MIKILIGSLFTALVIILIVLGLVNYNSRYSDTPDKDKFSFLNQFPYELQDNPTMKYNLIFKIFASFIIWVTFFITLSSRIGTMNSFNLFARVGIVDWMTVHLSHWYKLISSSINNA